MRTTRFAAAMTAAALLTSACSGTDNPDIPPADLLPAASDLGEGWVPTDPGEDTDDTTQFIEECDVDTAAMDDLFGGDGSAEAAFENPDSGGQVEVSISQSDPGGAFDVMERLADCGEVTMTEDGNDFTLSFSDAGIGGGDRTQSISFEGQGGDGTFTISLDGVLSLTEYRGYLIGLSSVGFVLGQGNADVTDVQPLLDLTVDRINSDVDLAAPDADPTPGETADDDTPDEAETTDEAPPEPSPEDEAAGPGYARDNPVDLGQTVELTEWTVTVDEINLDADQAVTDANEFNDPPSNGNYALVTITATYTGDTEGNAGFELNAVLSGADARQYGDTGCDAVEPNPMFDQPTVENGGTVTGQFCIDYPDDAIGDSAVLFIEETLSFEEVRGYWSLP